MIVKPGWTLLIVGLWLSALGVVYSSHQTRLLHAEVNTLTQTYDRLMVEWGRLTLEQGALSAPALLEQRSRELNMRAPGAESIELLREVRQ
ncbi:MAG: cell division protein FtsL [Natronospirillum sp.]